MYNFPQEVIEKYEKWKKECQQKKYCLTNEEEWIGVIGDVLDEEIINEMLEEKYDEEEYPDEAEIYTCEEFVPELPYIFDDFYSQAYDFYEDADFTGLNDEVEKTFLDKMQVFMHLLMIESGILPANFKHGGDKVGVYFTKTKSISLKRKIYI